MRAHRTGSSEVGAHVPGWHPLNHPPLETPSSFLQRKGSLGEAEPLSQSQAGAARPRSRAVRSDRPGFEISSLCV